MRVSHWTLITWMGNDVEDSKILFIASIPSALVSSKSEERYNCVFSYRSLSIPCDAVTTGSQTGELQNFYGFQSVTSMHPTTDVKKVAVKV